MYRRRLNYILKLLRSSPVLDDTTYIFMAFVSLIFLSYILGVSKPPYSYLNWLLVYVCSWFHQWCQWYTNIVQGSTNDTIGNTIGTNCNANGTTGSPSGCIGTIGNIENFSLLFLIRFSVHRQILTKCINLNYVQI